MAYDYSRHYKYRPDNNNQDNESDNISDDTKETQNSAAKRRIKIFLIIAGASILIILYVMNVMYVKSMLKEELRLQNELEAIKDQNQLLQSEINKLESPDRISEIATKKFGMIKSENPPKILTKPNEKEIE